MQTLDTYAENTIHHKASYLIGKHGFTTSDKDDIEQDLRLTLLTRQAQFTRSKGKWSTFVARVLERRIANIIRDRQAAIRDYRRSNPCDFIDETNDGHRSCLAEHSAAQDENRRDLHIDLTDVLANLPDEERTICAALMRGNITDTARQLGRSRKYIHKIIHRLREVFSAHGLDMYHGC